MTSSRVVLLRQIIVVLMTWPQHFVMCFPQEMYQQQYEYIIEGDINIGAVLSIHISDDGKKCAKNVSTFRPIEYVEGVIFAINEINNRSDILPDVTLGTVILDDCLLPEMVLARALQFMPSAYSVHKNASSCNSSTCQSSPYSSIPKYFDVVGVLGAYTSSLSIVLANVMSLFQIPQISHTSTSDLLSNKHRFPYFLRMLPPDKNQVKVIADLLHHFNWKYVSVVYSKGSYGQESERQLVKLFRDLDICVAQSIELRSNMDHSQYDDVIDSLRKYKDARVVVLYADTAHASSMIKSAQRKGAFREFIWTGSDALSLILDDDSEYCNWNLGSFSVRPFSAILPRFASYLKTQRVARASRAYGIRRLYSNSSLDTKFDIDKESARMNPRDIDDDYVPIFAASYVIDAVYAFAYALDEYIKSDKDCEGKKGKDIRQCIQGEKLLSILKNVTFTGSIGKISFDENGDVVGKYEIRQCQIVDGSPRHEEVGIWDMRTRLLGIRHEKLKWTNDNSSYYNHNETNSIPESVCAEPCSIGQIYSFSRETCCWKCVNCKSNEVASINSSRCEACPPLLWPDEDSRTTCVKITPSYFTIIDVFASVICIFAILGFIASLIVAFFFHAYRQDRIIRSSSRELSQIMLVGISVAFMLVFSFMTKPNSCSCYLNHVGFSLTFTFVYAPLLVKTNRIYRIFRAGRKTTALPRCTSSTSLVVIVTAIIFVQILIILLSTIMDPPEVKLRMPVRSEKFVELYCNMPLAGLLSSLSFNLFLVMICTFYAFKTRKLPDNYNESRFIAFCVDTTLLVWMSFVPTYFTTSRAYYKVIILSLALIVNSVVNLMCLFVPKLYALYQQKRGNAKSQEKCYNPLQIRTETSGLARLNNTNFRTSGAVSQLVGSQDSTMSVVSCVLPEVKSEPKLNGSVQNNSSAENSDLSVI